MEWGRQLPADPGKKCMKKASMLPYTVSVATKFEYNMNRVRPYKYVSGYQIVPLCATFWESVT